MIGLAAPGWPNRSLVAEDRSAEGVRDQTGPEPGPRWVRAGGRTDGQQRTPVVTEGSEEPQVNSLTKP